MSGRALVTGANGFVGTRLSKFLAQRGWEVLGAVHGAPESDRERPCDIRDAAEVDALFTWAGPVTHVFHLAAIAFVPEAGRDPVRAFDINLNGTVRVAEALRRHAPQARLIFAGTSGVYGPPQTVPMTEDHPINPQNPYDISKAAADHFLEYMHKAAELDAVRIRAFNHSGPGQSDDFVLSSFARQVAQIEAERVPPVLRVGNLEAARDFSHVDDIVRAYEAAALRGRSGAVYNVCSGRAHRVREALDILLGFSRVPIRVEVDPERLRSVDVNEVVGSYQVFAADTGWEPRLPFERILQDLLEYWRACL